MATFEKRRNTAGQITAIRVKVRRVGMPHLSKSFPVENGSQSALKKAEREAKIWVDEVSKGLNIKHGNIKSLKMQFNQLGTYSRIVSKQKTHPNTRLPFKRIISKTDGDDLILSSNNPITKILTVLVLECGLSLEEISRLRWQHILFNQKLIEVKGSSGIVSRFVPLTALAIEATLASKQRKYGLMFNIPISDIIHKLPNTLTQCLLLNDSHSIDNTIKKEAAFRMADLGMNDEQICTYLGINHLRVLTTETNSSKIFSL